MSGEIKKRIATPEEEKEMLEDDKHDEIIYSLGKLATAISQSKEDRAVADALKEAAKGSQAVAQAIRDIPKPETPDVNVQFDHEKFVTSMDKIADRIEKAIEKGVTAQENKLMVNEFNFVYDQGAIKTAKVIYIPANKISTKK